MTSIIYVEWVPIRRPIWVVLAVVLFAGLTSSISHTATGVAEPACEGNELVTAKSSLAQAKSALDKAIAAAGNESGVPRLQTWFGVRSSADTKSVRETLIKTRAFADGVVFLCAKNTNIRIGDVYAYVQPDKSFAVVLGAFFFQAPSRGFNSKLGILVHEISHFVIVGATKDTVYGVEGAKKLATTSPGMAQKNADNYEYYVEAVEFNL